MPLDPFSQAAIIAGGATLAASGASIAANANLNKKNRQWQEKMVSEQRAYDEKMYDQRYSPSAQSRAMAAAGLNPFHGVETMNVGSSSSVPTPANTPLDFSGIGQAGQAIASGLHAREAMKLQRDQFNHSVTNDTRKFLIELKQLDLSEQETAAMIKSKEEEIRGMRLKNDIEELNLTMLQEFKDAGGNTYTDASNFQQAQTQYIEAQTEYQNLMKKIAEEKRPHELELLKQQAASLKANAVQAYANAMYASAQAEVAKSQKINIDNNTRIANNQEGRDQALHLLKVYEQKLINAGIKQDNINKVMDNTRQRIIDGNIQNFGELDDFLYHHLHSLIPFADSPLSF